MDHFLLAHPVYQEQQVQFTSIWNYNITLSTFWKYS